MSVPDYIENIKALTQQSIVLDNSMPLTEQEMYSIDQTYVYSTEKSVFQPHNEETFHESNLTSSENTSQSNWKGLKDNYPILSYMNGTLEERMEQYKLLGELMMGKKGKDAAAIMVAAYEATMLTDIPWRIVNQSFEEGVGKEQYYNEAKNDYKQHKKNRPPFYNPIKNKIEEKLKELRLKE